MGRFKITFLPGNSGKPDSPQHKVEPIGVVEMDSEDRPSGDHGLPGSILDIALGSDIEVDHACGGVCACSTCHIIVEEGLDTCNESTEEEEDQLEEAPGLTMRSRLACQCVPSGTKNLVVRVPSWNRNAVPT